ncbi:glycosyltransferase family 4 protein [soil metagenome]
MDAFFYGGLVQENLFEVSGMKASIAIIENNIIATNTIRGKLTSTLVEKGYHVTVLTTGTEADLQQARQNGFNVMDVKGSTQNPLDIINYMHNLKKALKQTNTTVCLTFTIRPAIWGNVVTRHLNIPTITNITGIGPLFARNNIAYRAARTLYKFVLKKTAKIFFQNYDDMHIFLERGFVKPGRAERIPGSGIDHQFYQPMPARPADGKFIFLFISRLVKDKGILEYVEAARLLKNKLPNTEFKVLGPVWLQNLKDNTVTVAEVQQWVNEGVIDYLGDAKDVRRHIAAADCIVLPSYREGTSNVLLEASSMERPCITCNTTGCKEIVEDNVTGFLCKVQDAADLAAKMQQMYELAAEERVEMGKNARQKVIKEFDKQLVIDAYLKAIEKINVVNEL